MNQVLKAPVYFLLLVLKGIQGDLAQCPCAHTVVPPQQLLPVWGRDKAYQTESHFHAPPHFVPTGVSYVEESRKLWQGFSLCDDRFFWWRLTSSLFFPLTSARFRSNAKLLVVQGFLFFAECRKSVPLTLTRCLSRNVCMAGRDTIC